jgi:hypothetical protein
VSFAFTRRNQRDFSPTDNKKRAENKKQPASAAVLWKFYNHFTLIITKNKKLKEKGWRLREPF